MASSLARKLLRVIRGLEEWQMLHPLSAQEGARFFRECQQAEARAREAERQAVRRGDYAEADYWYKLKGHWREQADSLRAGHRGVGEPVRTPDQCGAGG